MRLSMTFPTFRSLLAVPFLAAILTFPAAAEPNPNNATPRVEAQTETGGTAPSATGEAKAGTTRVHSGKPEQRAEQFDRHARHARHTRCGRRAAGRA